MRHGHVENPRDILYGRMPGFRLSQLGIDQARAAARVLKNLKPSALYTSPLLRCRQTARYILEYHPGLRLRISNLITEVLTPYQGMPGAVIKCLRNDVYTGTPNGYEKPSDIVRRAQRFFNRVRRSYPGGTIVAVTHGDVIAFSILWARGYDLVPENRLHLGKVGIAGGYPVHGSITELTFLTDLPDERPRISCRTAHVQITS